MTFEPHVITMKTALLALALVVLAGCHGARLETPAGFATLGSTTEYSYRATSARGVVLATRAEPNEVKANTAFWAEALDAKLRDKGYAPDGNRNVKTERGLEGTQLRYVTTRNGRPHRYWISVFATDKKVFVVEAAGDKEPFDAAEAVVEKAVASLDATP